MATSGHSPIIDPIPSWPTRLSLGVRTWAFKSMIATALGTSRVLIPSMYAKFAPTYTKKYPVRPTLECRVFIPKTFQSGSTLPLYIDIHGGGYFGCDAALDDKICHYVCNKFNYVVVSLQYRLAPTHTFPVPVEDCTELTLAVLADPDLPVDHNCVAIGGMSAGGGLALAVPQDARLESKIKAVVAFYPPADFSHTFTGGFRDKPAGADGKGAQRDGLRRVIPLANWSYPAYGQDRTDPRLSPVYAERKKLPGHIYIIAAQYDKLCEEAFVMAKRWAQHDTAKEEEVWEVDGIRWQRVHNIIHGFIENGWRAELFGKSSAPWDKEVEDVIGNVGSWLDNIFHTSR